RGDAANPRSLLGAEAAADRTYQEGEQRLSAKYALAATMAELAYDQDVENADDDQLVAAEEAHDSRLEEGGRAYYTRELDLYQAYRDAWASAADTFATGVAVALREFRQRIWDAAQVAQPDVLAPQYGRQPLPQVMADLITAVNRLIQKQVPTRDRPP